MIMKPSNVQTKSVVFAGVDIRPVAKEFNDVQLFDWEGVRIGVLTKNMKPDANAYTLFLHLKVENEDGKECPYTIDVSIIGSFEFVGKESEDVIEDLVTVNGLSILYASIREMVSMVTSRMPHGSICLPGASFLDHRPSLKSKPGQVTVPRKQAVQKTAGRRASKTPKAV